MCVTKEDDVAAFFFCSSFDWLNRTLNAVLIAVSCKYFVFEDGKCKDIGTHAVEIAVACDMNDFSCDHGVTGDISVKLTLSVTKVKDPVSIGISVDNALDSAVVSM